MNYELLDEDLNRCGSASMDEILALRAGRERHDDDVPVSGAEYYVISPQFFVPIASAVSPVVSIAMIAESAERAYDGMCRVIEYMPGRLSTCDRWSELFAVSHALAEEAWYAAGIRPKHGQKVRFGSQAAMVEALQCLAADGDVPGRVRELTSDFLRALRA